MGLDHICYLLDGLAPKPPMNIRYTSGNRGENVKEHRFANHSKEYAKDDVHVNIHHSVPDVV